MAQRLKDVPRTKPADDPEWGTGKQAYEQQQALMGMLGARAGQEVPRQEE